MPTRRIRNNRVSTLLGYLKCWKYVAFPRGYSTIWWSMKLQTSESRIQFRSQHLNSASSARCIESQKIQNIRKKTKTNENSEDENICMVRWENLLRKFEIPMTCLSKLTSNMIERLRRGTTIRKPARLLEALKLNYIHRDPCHLWSKVHQTQNPNSFKHQ